MRHLHIHITFLSTQYAPHEVFKMFLLSFLVGGPNTVGELLLWRWGFLSLLIPVVCVLLRLSLLYQILNGILQLQTVSHMWHGLNNCGICNICFCQILSVSWSSRVVPLPHQGNQHLHIPLTCVLARSWEVCTCGSSGTSLLCRPSTFVLCVLFSFL